MPFLTPDVAPAARVCRRIFIPDHPDWLALVNGALSELIRVENWEQFGSVSPADAAVISQQMVLDFVEGTCMLGAVFPYVTVSPPLGCLPCDGSHHLRVDYPRLYDVLPADLIVGPDVFRTPDLRDRFVLGAGDNLPFTTGGAAAVSLEPEHNGRHTHSSYPHTHVDAGHTHLRPNSPGAPILVVGPGELVALAPSLVPGMTSVNNAILEPEEVLIAESGQGVPHENMPPFVALKWCIVAE